MKNNALYKYLYDEEFLIQTFGTLEPSIDQRTKKFFDIWCEWDSTQMFLKRDQHMTNIKSLLKGVGLKEFQDYQIRGYELRFKDDATKAISLLVLGDYCV